MKNIILDVLLKIGVCVVYLFLAFILFLWLAPHDDKGRDHFDIKKELEQQRIQQQQEHQNEY